MESIIFTNSRGESVIFDGTSLVNLNGLGDVESELIEITIVFICMQLLKVIDK